MTREREFARKLFARQCEFVAGAATLDALPVSRLPEVAFVGRSNVGKSSLINALTGRAALARVSNTPGRTRQINLFSLRDALMLADLPGYGFARVSKAEARSWSGLIQSYLRTRNMLRRVVLLIDARRGFMTSDEEVMSLLDGAAVATQIVLTKCDHLANVALADISAGIARATENHPATLPNLIASSAESGAGIADLQLVLSHIAAQ